MQAQRQDKKATQELVKDILSQSPSLSDKFADFVNVGAERAILSLMLNGKEKFQEIKATFVPEHFDNIDNQSLFRIICWISDNRCDGGFVTLQQIYYESHYESYMKEKSTYLNALKEYPYNENSYKSAKAMLLSKFSQRRKFAVMCESLGRVLDYNGDSIEDILMIGSDENLNLIQENADKFNIVEIVGSGLRERLRERAANPCEVAGIGLIKYPEFSKMIGGLRSGKLIVGAARPKRGKSTFQFGMAIDIGINQKIPVGIVESEMDRIEQEDRLVAALSSVETRKIENGLFIKSKEDTAAIKQALELIEANPNIYMRKLPLFDTQSIMSSFRLMHALYGIRVGFFDQIKDTMDTIGTHSEKESQRIGWLAFALKSLAEDLGIPIVANMQLSRAGVDAQLASGEVDPATVLADSDKVLRLANTCYYIRKKTSQEIIRDQGIAKGGNTVINVFAGRGHASHSWTAGINYYHRTQFTRFEEIGNIVTQ
jgi:replicative DNA helicase